MVLCGIAACNEEKSGENGEICPLKHPAENNGQTIKVVKSGKCHVTELAMETVAAFMKRPFQARVMPTVL